MASVRQVAANRENGLKGGVKTEDGKAITRLNARRSALSSRPMGKHSIFVTALTEEDSEEVCGYEDELIAELRPVGRIEEMLVEKVALTWLRIQRCARAEAEHHISICQTPNTMKLIDLYDTRLTNQFLKLLHEIERLQLLRKGKEGQVAPQKEEELSGGMAEPGNEVKPAAPSAVRAPEPAATETSCPPSQPLPFLPHTEDAPEPTTEQPQDAVGHEADAQTAI